jgi:signal peptidase I
MRVILVVIFAATVVAAASRQSYQFPSRSMEPTIKQGERIVVEPIDDGCNAKLERGAVVTFLPPMEKDIYLKRLMAFGGETVELRDMKLYIDGKVQDDPHAFYSGRPGEHLDFPATKVPQGHFFMLGDNRDRSSDSRVWGPVPCASLRGRWIPRP